MLGFPALSSYSIHSIFPLPWADPSSPHSLHPIGVEKIEKRTEMPLKSIFSRRVGDNAARGEKMRQRG